MQLQNLLRRANEISQQTDNPTNNNNNENEYKEIWKRIRKLKPRWAEANARYGMALLGTPNNQKKAIELLHRSIDIQFVDDPISLNTPQGLFFASTVGRYYHHIDQTVRAIPIIDEVYLANPNDLCLALMSSTMILHQVPTSIEKEDEIVREYLERTNIVLTRLQQQQQQQLSSQTQTQITQQEQNKWTMDEQYLSQTFPGAASDPYDHCMISEFIFIMSSLVLQHVCVRRQLSHVLILCGVWLCVIVFISPQIYYIYHSIMTRMYVNVGDYSATAFVVALLYILTT